MTTKVKICCIQSLEEAEMAIAAGAHALGLVSAMPSGPGVISDADIETIAAATKDRVARFLLTSRTDAMDIIAHIRQTGVDTVQLVDAVGPSALQQIRSALPDVNIVQVLHVTDAAVIPEAIALQTLVDGFLLDSGNPAAARKELGGTGRVHDWSVSQRLVAAVQKPVYLAGGLRPENVGDAIRKVRPGGVDICTGLRQDLALQPDRLAAYMDAVRTAG